MHSSKKLILGGAQIGQEYGFVRKSSFAGGEGVQALLDKAWGAGFSAIDTARTYGRSEEIIGSLSWNGGLHTKLDESDDPETSIVASLSALDRDAIDLLYVCHDASRVASTSHEYWAAQFKKLGDLCSVFGAAIYPEQMDSEILRFPEIKVIQIPFNIVSPSHLRKKVIEWHLADKAVLARSVFAQGLLLRGHVANSGSAVAGTIDVFHDLCQSLSRSPAEVAFRWCLAQTELDGIVVGISRAEEIEPIADWFGKGPLPEDEYSFIERGLGSHRRDIDLRRF